MTTRSYNRGTSISAGTRRGGITNNVTNRITASSNMFAGLAPEKRSFASQLKKNMTTGKRAITAATNTSNIMAKPDFLELLPMFVQKLLITDVFGSVAMNSRQQFVPYFKFIAENTKGETEAGSILSSPFVNRQGVDPNFTGRVVKNETFTSSLAYTPVLPGTVTIASETSGVVTKYTDNGAGGFVDASGQVASGASINYATGAISGLAGTTKTATYQYDNETVGPDENGTYISDNVLLGHRRLIVIDPKGGSQPMIKKYENNDYRCKTYRKYNFSKLYWRYKRICRTTIQI